MGRRKGEALSLEKFKRGGSVNTLVNDPSCEFECQTRWYVLFVTTGRENAASRDVSETFDENRVKPFTPSIETVFKRAGFVNRQNKLMFPGYLFVETDITNKEFVETIQQCIRSSKHVMKLLDYGDRYDAALKDNERGILDRLLNKTTYRIEASTVFKEGDEVIVIDGPLKGCESKIKRFNHHKSVAVIEFEIFGELREVSVGAEFVKKMPINFISL